MSKQIPKVTVPRKLEEIRAEYDELRLKVADAQYQIFVYEDMLRQFNLKMVELNREGGERIELDKKSAEETQASSEDAPQAGN